MSAETTHSVPGPTLAGSAGSAASEAWRKLNPILRGAVDWEDFEMGWQAAMRSIWDRLPSPEYARDPMTPREVEKLLDYVRANLPPNQPGSPAPSEGGHHGS